MDKDSELSRSLPAEKEARPHISAAERTELNKLFDAYNALKALGWKEPRYSGIRDGEHFELIELGSTGIHRAYKDGPYVWVDGEWPSHPFLVRRIEK